MPTIAAVATRAVVFGKRLGTPVLRAVTGTGTSSTTSKAITTPAGVQNGDVMLAMIFVNNTTSVITDPSGWTFIRETSPAGTTRQRTYWKVVDAEPASYTWGLAPSASISGAMGAYRDCDTTSPIDPGHTGATAATGTATATGFTTQRDNTMLVMIASTSGSRNYTASTLTEQYDSAANIGWFDGVQAAAGASGDKTATISSAASSGSQLIGIKPAGSD
jgi:hypothetical protein